MSTSQDFINTVAFNDQGLVPVIAQSAQTREVLMLAWMNQDALEQTIQTKRATYWSRTRNEIWRKGDTSGNIQSVKSISQDCDGDSLLIHVDQIGPACHTGLDSCFDTKLFDL